MIVSSFYYRVILFFYVVSERDVCCSPTGAYPNITVAKIQNVWESAKKVLEKFGGNGKNAYLCSVKKRISLKG